MATKSALCILMVLALSPLAIAQRPIDSPPTDTAFEEQIRQLDPKTDKAVRLRALGWINANSRYKNAALAIPSLERCIREDPVAEVRQQAVLDLCLVAKELGRPCPLTVIEALHDKEDFVRWQAVACTPIFKSFAPGSVEVLLRGVAADKADVRSNCLYILAHAGGKDEKALAAMEKAKQDKVFDVRHAAHSALLIARNSLEEHLPYLIRVREDPASVLSPVPEDSEAGKRERAERNLILLGSSMQIVEWSETRAEELAAVLLKLLGDKSAVMRRGAANLIAASAVKVEVRRKPEGHPLLSPVGSSDSWFEAILPYVETLPSAESDSSPKTKPIAPPEKSKVALRLEKLSVVELLTKLRDGDPDASSRTAARTALKRLMSVEAKKP